MKRNKIPALLLTSFLLASCMSSKLMSDSKDPLACPLVEAQNAPVLMWSLGGFSNPESVVLDEYSKNLFVSNVDGSPPKKDGKGWISKVSLQGKFIEKKWSQGRKSIDGVKESAPLNAPKGMKIRGGLLWVTDIDRVMALQLSSGRKAVVVEINGAKFLNDIGFGKENEEIFVSDMLDNKIYSIDKPAKDWVWLQGPVTEAPNGLLGLDNELLVAGWGVNINPNFQTERVGRILSVNYKTKNVQAWTKEPMGNLDGLESDGNDAVLVSDWMNGRVMRLTRSGKCTTLLQLPQGAADIHFIEKDRILLVPQMNDNNLKAYKLPKYL